ncbi:MAG TPA: hypothetical protein VEU96_27915 [Bryobacteraceae bacterium]|nr:hypothetical protein [Bryobacteraceae bacterium]
MTKLALLMCICAAALSAQTISSEEHAVTKGKKLWRWSLAALAAGNIADMHSSWGRPEANPLLAGANGRFDWRSATIKLGIQAPLIGFQLWRVHKNPSPSLYKSYSFTNFAVGGAFGGVAIHNYRLPQSRLPSTP